jgi:hypothetical protein
MGGARRDEERARAKERVFSFRDDFGQWNPRAQRPELWNLYNARIRKGEHIRVFPISNWTELDVWQYVARERLELPSIYFAHEREVFRRDGMLYSASEFVERFPEEETFSAKVRFRTVGDMTCTGGVLSDAATLPDVVDEIAATRITERGETRADDRVSEAAMEDRKRVGYFWGADGHAEPARLVTAGSVDTRKSTHRTAALDTSRSSSTNRAHGTPRGVVATTTSTSPCSPTVCVPSASRASRSTSPIARSSRRGGGSS